MARRHRLRHEDAEDLLGAIRLKLIENDYEVLRRFEGRASLSTYLTAVVTRHLLDRRNAHWGKWRPSIYARRAGPVATQLEMLMTRDGLPFEQAVQVLRSRSEVPESDEQLYRLAVGFPHRLPRRFVETDALEQLGYTPPLDRDVDRDRREALAAKTEAALRTAMSRLPPQDRLLLRMHFEQKLQLSQIARVLQVEQKPLYRRKEQVLAVLASELARQGIGREDIIDITGGEFDFDIGGDDAAGKPAARPSASMRKRTVPGGPSTTVPPERPGGV